MEILGIFKATIAVPWVILVIVAALIFVAGAMFAKRFGTEWLAALRYLLSEDELKALARLMWQAGLVPTVWRKVRFSDNEDLFVEWVITVTRGLWDERAALQRTAIKRQIDLGEVGRRV